MKTYGTAFLILFFFFSSTSIQAQFSIYGGPQITTASYSIRDTKQPTDSKIGFMAGVRLGTQVEGPLYFSPLLYFSRKGYKVTYNLPANLPDSSALNNNTSMNSISLAPLLQFNFSKAKSHFFLRFGPGFDVAISGREIFDATGNRRVDRDMPFQFDGYSFGTLFGAFQVGFQHQSGLLLFAHYEHGLSSLNNKDFGPFILHRVAGVSVGWRLGKAR